MKHTFTRASVALGAALALTATPAVASAPGTSTIGPNACSTPWGSLPKTASPMSSAPVLAVRAGQHVCFDRVVIDLGRGTGNVGYSVEYVDAVTNPASGMAVPVAGGARLQVSVHAPATARVPASGSMTFTGWPTLRQLVWVSSFEGYTDWGVGVRARLPMRAFVLPATTTQGQRLVIDIAHRW